MRLFFNDPRAAFVTTHRRIRRRPLVVLVAGGVGVAALGIALGTASWDPPAPQQPVQPQREAVQQGLALPAPVTFDMPAAPQPMLGIVVPPPAEPTADSEKGKTAKPEPKGRHRAVESGQAQTESQRTARPTARPTPRVTTDPTIEPTVETPEPTATQPPAEQPQSQQPPAEQPPAEQPQTVQPGEIGQPVGAQDPMSWLMTHHWSHAGNHDRSTWWP